VLVRAYRRTGRTLPLAMRQNIGTRAALAFRSTFGQEPPKLWEYNADVPKDDSPSGWVAVAFYPGPALALLDEAIDTFLALEAQPAPPIPALPPRCPWCRGEMRNAHWQELCAEHLREVVAQERSATRP
jgi:hypothetical protein